MKSVVLLSGGLDSTVLLATRLNNGDDVHPIFFDYRQQHYLREYYAACHVAIHYNVALEHTQLPVFGGVLTTSAAELPAAPYVPARNTCMLAIAVGYAEAIEADVVHIGANADDHNEYPDCRAEFVRAMNSVAQIGTRAGILVDAPLVHHTKRQIVAIGRELDVPLHLTWSCYEGLAAGPCGHCSACTLREAAFA